MPTGAETDRGKGIPSRRAPCLIESGLTRGKCEAGDRRSGGTVTMPIRETFRARRFGMLWGVNCEKPA